MNDIGDASPKTRLDIAPDAQLAAECRAWIADCAWADLEDAEALTDAESIAGVERHYDGGLRQFIADGKTQ